MPQNSTDQIPELVEYNKKKFDQDYTNVVSYLKWVEVDSKHFDYSEKTNVIGINSWLYDKDLITYKKAGDANSFLSTIVG